MDEEELYSVDTLSEIEPIERKDYEILRKVCQKENDEYIPAEWENVRRINQPGDYTHVYENNDVLFNIPDENTSLPVVWISIIDSCERYARFNKS